MHYEEHFHKITRMMQGFGQSTPTSPIIPSDQVLLARLRMLKEEFDELVDACGYDYDPFEGQFVKVKEANLVEMVDAIADIQVVNTGNAVACGVYLPSVVDIVDDNNMLKISNGHLDPETGKFIKPKNHPKPDISGELARQIEDSEELV